MRKPRLLVVHGIHTNDDAGWMEWIVEEFRAAGWDARSWTYGYAWALLTRWQNPGRAKKLAAIIEPGDIVLGHSNGCTLTYMASMLGAPIGGAILLNPALDTDRVLGVQVPWINLYANRGDCAVPFAGLFPRHPWGPQGCEGLTVHDPRYRTVFTDEGKPRVWGHSDILSVANLEPWTVRLIDDAEARMRPAKAANSKFARAKRAS